MQIDWFTFTAQIVNFLVLVALLRRFLYRPIVRAMKKREERIANSLQEADRKQTEAEERVREYEQKMREIEERKEELREEARNEAQQERKQLVRKAREDVERQREQWQEHLRREQEDFLSELRRQAGRLATEAASRTLSQLADENLNERMFAVFDSRLQQLDGDQREEITRHLRRDGSQVRIRSAFDVSEQWREKLRKSIRENLGYEDEISFEKIPDLVCGLELQAGGYNFGWNIKDFLQNMELDFRERLKTHG